MDRQAMQSVSSQKASLLEVQFGRKHKRITGAGTEREVGKQCPMSGSCMTNDKLCSHRRMDGPTCISSKSEQE